MKLNNIRNSFVYLFFLFFILAATYTILNKGPWIDEGYSLYYGANNLSLKQKFFDVWVLDVHPPLFSFINYMVNNLYSIDVIIGRFLNFIPFIILLIYIFPKKETHDFKKISIISAIIFLSTPEVFTSFVNYRSYFTANVFFLILSLSLLKVYKSNEIKRYDLFWLFLSFFICVNIHYIYAFISCITFLVFFISFVLDKSYIKAKILFFTGILSVIPVFIFLYIQKSYIESTHNNFWIETSALGAIKTFIVLEIKDFIIPSFILILLSIIFFFKKYFFENFKLFLILWISIILSSFFLLLINYIQPMVVSRYVTGIAILSTLSIISLIYEKIDKRIISLVILFSTILVLKLSYSNSKILGWNTFQNDFKLLVSSCPSSKIYPFYSYNGEHFRSIKEQNNMINTYDNLYKYVADHNHFKIQPINDPSSKPYTGSCPNIIWLEHKVLKENEIKSVLNNFRTCNIEIKSTDGSNYAKVTSCK